MEGGNETRGLGNSIRWDEEHCTNKDRYRSVQGFGDDPGMSDRANRAVVARQLGVPGMYVNRLDETNKADQKDTDNRQKSEEWVLAHDLAVNQSETLLKT